MSKAKDVVRHISDLVGQKINRTLVDKTSGRPVLFLVTEEGIIWCLSTEGDCCANAFIQHVSNSDALMLSEVTSVEEIETVSSNQAFYEVVDQWGHRIHTTRGTVTIECRTEHNEHHPGWCPRCWWRASGRPCNMREVSDVTSGTVDLEDF